MPHSNTFSLAGAILCGALLFGGPSLADEDCKTVQLGGHPNFPPLIWSSDGEMKGVGSIVAEQLLHDLNHDIEHVGGYPYKRVQLYFKRGRIDIIGLMARNRHREEYAHFIEPPYAYAEAVVWTRRDEPVPFNELNDLLPFKGVLLLGTSYGDDYDDFVADHPGIAYKDDVELAIEMLAKGYADFFIYDRIRGDLAIRKLGLKGQIIAVGTPVRRNPLYLAISKASPCMELADDLARGLKAFLDSGQMPALIEAQMEAYLQQPE